jgi:hypothetical protein
MKYELYEYDKLVMTFNADGHVRDFGLPDTISLYGVSAKDKAEIDKHVSSAVQPPSEKRGKLYKILQEKPI